MKQEPSELKQRVLQKQKKNKQQQPQNKTPSGLKGLK